MKVTITYIELKGPLKFFALSTKALKIVRQLKTTDCADFKKRGFWTKHFTMTLWNSEDEMKAFARSGAHAQAMKESAEIAKEIGSITIDTNTLPSWKEAQEILKNAKVIRF